MDCTAVRGIFVCGKKQQLYGGAAIGVAAAVQKQNSFVSVCYNIIGILHINICTHSLLCAMHNICNGLSVGRLYAAAKYITTQEDMNLVQLVSFGCGVDAITTDETRSILESADKIYTQIKIDEITNLGAVKIRLRSLLAAIDEKKER